MPRRSVGFPALRRRQRARCGKRLPIGGSHWPPGDVLIDAAAAASGTASHICP
jgi:hypothetical protein